MRALRVVGILENDGEFAVVLEDADRRERFTVPADEQLRAAARGDLTRLGQNAIEVESQLRPREIQARIRAGASVEQVAAMAGVPLQKIERFAYPVLLERTRTAEVAQRAHPVRADGPDTRMLGDVVAHTFGLRGQEYADFEWDAWKGEDGKWVAALSWHAGHSDNRAHWTFQPGANGGTVTALDENAFDLVEGLPARPLRPVGPVIDIARSEDPGPAPAPMPELRAAAESGRRGPDAGYSTMERTPTRTAPEPRRPVPPAQRQAPTEPRPTEPRPAEHRPTEHRQAEPNSPRGDAAEPRDGGSRQVQPPAAERHEAPTVPPPTAAPRPADPAPTEAVAPEPVEEPATASAEAAPAATGAPQAEVRHAEAPQAEPPAPEPTPEPPAAEPVAAEPVGEEAVPVEPEAPAAEAPTPPADEPAPEVAASEKTEPAPAAKPAARRTKKGKPVMPSWDEVLLGVRGQH